jgi:uncharacterized membrane protein
MEEPQATTPVKELDSNQKFMAAVTYLLGFITGVIFLLVEKKDKFIRYHAYQSTAVSILWLAAVIVLGIILLPIPILKNLVNLLLWIGWIILWISLMIRAFNGEKYKLPYVGEWAEKQVAKE